MKICFICEGSYPYISGGVSSWIQMMINYHNDFEFQIWSIATTKEEMNTYRYKIPENVTEIKTFYVGEQALGKAKKKIKLKPKEKKVLRNLIVEPASEIKWHDALELIKKYKKHLNDLLISQDFFEIALSVYNQTYSNSPFNEFLWSLRGMFLPFMSILTEPIIKSDIYHAVSTGYAGILASAAAYVTQKPFILSEHGIYTREREEDIIRSNWLQGEYKELWINFFKKLSTIAYNQADIVTTLFENNKSLEIELGCPESKIRIITNGVDIEGISNLSPRSEESKEFFNIGTILRIVPIKDVKTMILGYGEAKKNIANAKLYILGNYDESPEYYQECTELVSELAIQDVIFCGHVNVKDYLPIFDLLLLTSISEGQPLSVLEGMAASIAYICTNVGDCKGLIDGREGDNLGKAGIIIPIMDSEELAKQIIYCDKHREELKLMGEIGRKRVVKYYQKEDFLKTFKKMYLELGE